MYDIKKLTRNSQPKNVLDIGGGSGYISFYFLASGAEKSICLEPEEDGSTEGIMNEFNLIRKTMDFEDNASLLPITFQNYNAEDKKYDFISLYHSVNHLNESATVSLAESKKAQDIYVQLFKKMFDMTAPGGTILCCDIARNNVFGDLGLKNPLASTIEWEKHQSPYLWAELFKEAGFVDPKIRWSTFGKGKPFVDLFLSNKIASYFIISHFCMTVKKPNE